MNNIICTKVGGNCNSNNKNTNLPYDHNIYFFGKSVVKVPNDKVIYPQFVNFSMDGLVTNFSLKVGTLAIDAGTQSVFSPKYIKGVARPKGGTVDCGAY